MKDIGKYKKIIEDYEDQNKYFGDFKKEDHKKTIVIQNLKASDDKEFIVTTSYL